MQLLHGRGNPLAVHVADMAVFVLILDSTQEHNRDDTRKHLQDRCGYYRYGELCHSLYFIPQELLVLEEWWYARCRAVGNQGIPFRIVAVVIGVDGSIPWSLLP